MRRRLPKPRGGRVREAPGKLHHPEGRAESIRLPAEEEVGRLPPAARRRSAEGDNPLPARPPSVPGRRPVLLPREEPPPARPHNGCRSGRHPGSSFHTEHRFARPSPLWIPWTLSVRKPPPYPHLKPSPDRAHSLAHRSPSPSRSSADEGRGSMTARGDRGGARHALLTILPVMAGNPSLPASPRCLWAYSVS